MRKENGADPTITMRRRPGGCEVKSENSGPGCEVKSENSGPADQASRLVIEWTANLSQAAASPPRLD